MPVNTVGSNFLWFKDLLFLDWRGKKKAKKHYFASVPRRTKPSFFTNLNEAAVYPQSPNDIFLKRSGRIY